MRILYTIDSLAPENGGTSRSVPLLAAALSSEGDDVAIISATDGARRYRDELAVRCEAIDVLHDHGVWLRSNHFAARVASATRTPRVVSTRGMLEPWSLRHHRVRKRIAWWLYQRRDLRRAIVLHATSAMEAENLRSIGLRQPIAVVPNGVDLPARVSARVRNHGETRTVLFLSRVHPKKGLIMLVDAWNAVRPDGWRAVIAGPDENGHRREVESAIDRAGLRHVFEFAGTLDDREKWKHYAAADVFVLPTYSENFGLVVAEALAAELPVITTTGTPWQSLIDEQCGWWVEPTAAALVTALRAATGMTDADRTAMGARGREHVERNFSWRRAGAEMHAVYEWILGGGAAPACVALK